MQRKVALRRSSCLTMAPLLASIPAAVWVLRGMRFAKCCLAEANCQRMCRRQPVPLAPALQARVDGRSMASCWPHLVLNQLVRDEIPRSIAQTGYPMNPIPPSRYERLTAAGGTRSFLIPGDIGP